MNIGYIAIGVLEILDSTNHGFYQALAKVKEGKVSLSYEIENGSPESFLDIDIPKKEMTFHTLPKSYSTEQACKKLTGDIKREGFKVKGLISFLESPLFKPNQIFLH